ncbi:unnamed protein product [Callosobruchus maculatus]|uniref:Uncharacterized protein n=2 Tax=Callosobruchus maculatus TaxID=64391 RepID=A0A653D827_CALMS|nr:unnamed protein product [Callosobruchus maculatus]
MWQEFSHKLADQVLLPLNTYQSQFPEMRKKIDKRNRKLIDYDSQRHSFQALQANSSKRRDEVKLQRGREQLDEAKRTYEMLNSELHDELPALYDSRVLFLVTNLQSLFNAEGTFHTEASKVYNELESIVDKLATDSQRGSYTIKKTNGTTGSLPRSTISTLKNSSELIMNNTLDTLNSSKTPSNDAPSPLPIAAADSPTNAAHSPPDSPTPAVEMNGNSTISAIDSPDSPEPRPPLAERHVNPAPSDKGDAPAVATNAIGNAQEHKKVEELYDIPPGATTDNLPPGVLYRVKATYKYNREDVDELSFEVGEVINVVEYDDPEEQEEGWLMGIKETTGEKGMFPANFTRPL